MDAIDRPGRDRDQDACLVIDDLGELGLIYCESDVATANVENVIEDLLDGQYYNPIRIISFNVADGWSRDISAQVAPRGGAFLSLSSVRAGRRGRISIRRRDVEVLAGATLRDLTLRAAATIARRRRRPRNQR